MSSEYINGMHSVKTVLQMDGASVKKILLNKKKIGRMVDSIVSVAKKSGVSCEYVDCEQLDKICPESNHQGVVAVVSSVAVGSEADLLAFVRSAKRPPFLLFLDGVQDPHNLGACLRSANAAGVDGVVVPKDNATGLTPVVHKVSTGASRVTPFYQVTNFARAIKSLKEEGVWFIGAAGESEQNYLQVDYKGSVAIVMGSEGDGLRRLTREHCDFLVKIPMVGHVESLNVSVATGVMLFEALRQRSL